MKTPPFLLIGCPVIALSGAVVYLVTFKELHHTPFHLALIEAETLAPAGHLGEILVQLDLTDAQQQQIDQIRQGVSDPHQRRRAILAVLTPDQRVRFQQLLLQQQKDEAATDSFPVAP